MVLYNNNKNIVELKDQGGLNLFLNFSLRRSNHHKPYEIEFFDCRFEYYSPQTSFDQKMDIKVVFASFVICHFGHVYKRTLALLKTVLSSLGVILSKEDRKIGRGLTNWSGLNSGSRFYRVWIVMYGLVVSRDQDGW
ncbi:hypothetical protein F4703DRAFT_1794058 [Phycomyces blakesleeanus]|uniref:Uncharacterized protein n=1 Tax=Phycomyces blakesleeanus (strain ATCC 8743b / DSM 1359 / FGSC 10004 / NBRC 33097 / NRRL 1555) TaxID=763407 RepID=A0A163AG62_PHYB8|nr:hypothetical protein PHYBLDRAFT_168626 [Phycomyces blakesleeanus NRRL 1555(-)]OAD73271.1 hypothetical protein PHYBLDRAFT_168626 [Phycomyces blakesleeanus NRRL 1555(-)]|eukprot:XP_018291311.1 hypothetical protein PHYBLDRAFT_168626 [Phycomyces blakesleeanus NRRL 1555(-)]